MFRTIFAALAWVLMLLTCFSVSQAAWLEDVILVNYGRYSAQTASELTQADSQTKLSLLSDLKLKQKTTRIPAEVGCRFGLEVELKGTPLGEKIPLQVVVEHPPIINPKTGEASRSVSWRLYPRLGDVIYTGWEFIADYECVPGQWTIRLQQDKRRLAEQHFRVFLPEKQQKPSREPAVREQEGELVYLVQTGVYSKPEFALEHMQKLRMQGYEPCILPKQKADTTLYFIFISAETTQQAADESAGNFREATGMDVYLNTTDADFLQENMICPKD
jgi:hypothetical protein